ncbi:MAG: hypothetical protein QOJ19_4669 [Acidimicrobiia bacterium]|jgi:acetyl-CoA carboxylase carboxyltransferase component|nr:hypothetical protein [Acidimicrobiia bacterium]
MSWEPEVEELRRRRALAERMGGEDKVERQHFFGKLTVRERVARMADPGSFREVGQLSGIGSYDADGTLTEFTPSNLLFGRATVDRRPVIISGDDFTVRGGSSELSIPKKSQMVEQLALELEIPIIRLIDGMGGGGSVKELETIGRTYVPDLWFWPYVVESLATVPQVSLALGSVAGIGAARVVTSHYSLMVQDISLMMIAGPALIDHAGEQITKEDLGGTQVHTTNGAVDDVVTTEDEAFERARRFLSYLPSSANQLPPRGPTDDDPQRREEFLLEVVPRNRRRPYKMREVIEAVVDRGSWMEIGRGWGKSVITGLARLDGWPTAVLSEDPYIYGGAWTADGSEKAVRLLDLANTFHLPIVHLVDVPGFYIGSAAERDATIRKGSRALAALVQSQVPFCSVIIRKAFGVAGGTVSVPQRAPYRFAWPSADWGSLPIEGGIEVAYKAELNASEDRAALLEDITGRLNGVRSPFRTAEAFGIEDIIDPRDTRPLLCEWANLAAAVRKPGRFQHGYRP